MLDGEIVAKLLPAVLAVKKRLSGDQLSVDGTLIEAWAWIKSVNWQGRLGHLLKERPHSCTCGFTRSIRA